jgi:membrane associated rhomboid family serine protease
MIPFRDHNPSAQPPYVTVGLILFNVTLFLGLWPLGDWQSLGALYREWGAVPRLILRGEGLHGLITAQFLHAGWLHLASNMLFLWIFGDNLEEALGHLRFLGFYLLCGVIAALVHVVVEHGSSVPMVGASGAIAGVMGGYLLLFPRARVDIVLIFVVFWRVIALPAWGMLGVWFGLQLLGGVISHGAGGGVAYWAHVGGFVAGALLLLRLWRRLGGRLYWRRWQGAPPHPEAVYAMPVVRKKGTPLPPPPPAGRFRK